MRFKGKRALVTGAAGGIGKVISDMLRAEGARVAAADRNCDAVDAEVRISGNLLDPALGLPQELHDDELFRSLPVSFTIFRIYSKDHAHDEDLNAALKAVLDDTQDSKTNM